MKMQRKSNNGSYVYRRKLRIFKPDSLSIIPEISLNGQQRILDVGCADAKLLEKLAEIHPNAEFYGVDIHEKYIKKNESRLSGANFHFYKASAEHLPFENNFFDIVISTNTMSKFRQRVRALDEMYRVLKPGGECFILEGISDREWKDKFDKILRQSKFIRPVKKFLPRTALLKKSYLIRYKKSH